ncbi:MAG: hypothetical protein PHU27_13325, partial [Salinivirgaceae bacterium]|nr:hypothetical protein [Salinivirgaceae bacterium]
DVMDWILHLGAEPIRINEEDIVQNRKIEFTIEDKEFNIILKTSRNRKISFKQIDYAWQRKWVSNFQPSRSNNFIDNDKILTHLSTEIAFFRNAILTALKIDNKLFGFTSLPQHNKLNQLLIARQVGLNIPKTKIANHINIKNIEYYITKPIHFPITLYDNDKVLTTYTTEINERIPNSSFPSLVQNRIRKTLEIRVLYIEGDIYSMATLDLAKQNLVDIREQNINSHRKMPYSLPNEIAVKIKNFMNTIDLEYGLIDLILGTDHKYYFLEVNHVGQFSSLSIYCNHNVEKIIAQKLINNGKSKIDRKKEFAF